MEEKPFENKVWIASPTMHGEEMEYIQQAYDTNWMSTCGENITVLENIIADKVGMKYGVALSCGTSALHLAMKLSGIKKGEKVFCSDLTFAATVNPILYEGGTPIFIDSEYETWNMDPVALEKAFEIYPDVRKIVVVHLYGTPCKMDEIRAIADRYGAVIIEDAAESLGATYKGKQTGSFGNIGCISFNGNKIITGTSGGMLLTNNEDDANTARKWSTQSRENAVWYQHEDIGYNYRMSNIIAGVVRGQLPHLEEHIALKKAIYNRYKEGFKGLPIKMNPYDENVCEPNYWLSCMVINEEAMCQQVRNGCEATYVKEKGKSCPTEILEMLERYNIECRPIWKPMHMQPVFKNTVYINRFGKVNSIEKNSIDKDAIKKCGLNVDVGTDIFNRGLCLPSDIKMTEEVQNKIIEIVRNCFE